MPICAVPGCTNKPLAGKRTLHHFPTESSTNFNLWKRWLKNIRKDDFRITKASRICSDHFKIQESNYREAQLRFRVDPNLTFRVKLNEGAVPCLCPGVPMSKQMEDAHMQYKIIYKRSEREAEVVELSGSEDESDEDDVWLDCNEEVEQEVEIGGDIMEESEQTTKEGEIEFDDIERVMKDPLTCPKVIVSLDRVYELLAYCRSCKRQENKITEVPTHAASCLLLESHCTSCGFAYEWTNIHSSLTTYHWNLLMSAAILFAGCLPTQIYRMFTNMKVLFSVPSTFFRHQQYIRNVINTYYREQQRFLVNLAQTNITGVTLAGDARCDSMGSSAHYSLYTMADVNLHKVIEIQLVTRPETGHKSPNMEFEGLKRCLKAIEDFGLKIRAVITDQHRSIIPYFRDTRTDITHYHDCWHVVKGVMKQLKKISQRKDKEEVKLRINPIRNRLYKIASSVPPSDNREVIMDNFITGMERHLDGQHSHPDLVYYPRCEHAEPDDTHPPSIPLSQVCPDGYDEVLDVLHNKQRRACIRRMSPHGQTSINEAFKSTVLWFTPKHVHFKFPAMLARSQLAVLHYNENSNKLKTGQQVIYKKYEGGRKCVKDVRVDSTYNYVSRLMELTLLAVRGNYTIVKQPPAPPEITAAMENKEDADTVLQSYQTRFSYR